jgi:uncharacterized protein YndB with AHSA1/START domain
MANDLIARASVTINAPADRVWSALVDPEAVKQYMFGTTVTSHWVTGSPITWKGEWKGNEYEDTGEVLDAMPNRMLKYSHLTGGRKGPGNEHIVTIELFELNGHTRVSLMQDKNTTQESRNESENNWKAMLAGLKKLVEAQAPASKS